MSRSHPKPVFAPSASTRKSNMEFMVHAMSKHGKMLDKCFPGANVIAEEIKVLVSKTRKVILSWWKTAASKKKAPKGGDLGMLDDALYRGVTWYIPTCWQVETKDGHQRVTQ
jgi:Na+-translocating ferredoxin:NAD+ oxidoreductase RNF subunit RnfB